MLKHFSSSRNTFWGFFLGILLSILIFLAIYFLFFKKENGVNKDYYILANQISHLNKMVVIEQDFSSFQTHKSSLGKIGDYSILPKEMVLFCKAKAQVSYNLHGLKIEIDSTNKKLIINQLPNSEIKIFPEVKIHFMDDYFINRFSQEELNTIMESAKNNMSKTIDQNNLRTKGREQLLKNLDEIFVLARYLHYEIVDKTNTFNGNLH